MRTGLFRGCPHPPLMGGKPSTISRSIVVSCTLSGVSSLITLTKFNYFFSLKYPSLCSIHCHNE